MRFRECNLPSGFVVVRTSAFDRMMGRVLLSGGNVRPLGDFIGFIGVS
jgi:hypothetical protein